GGLEGADGGSGGGGVRGREELSPDAEELGGVEGDGEVDGEDGPPESEFICEGCLQVCGSERELQDHMVGCGAVEEDERPLERRAGGSKFASAKDASKDQDGDGDSDAQGDGEVDGVGSGEDGEDYEGEDGEGEGESGEDDDEAAGEDDGSSEGEAV
ncbi:hypothetical protein HDV00_001428, partial [Rhizophlyctis rosea]